MKKLNPFWQYHLAFRNDKFRGYVIIITLVYIFSPIDFIPDPLLGFGQIDDLILIIMFVLEIIAWQIEKRAKEKNIQSKQNLESKKDLLQK